MDTKSRVRKSKREMSEEAEDLLNKGKRFAGTVHKEGMDKMHDAEDAVKEYSDELIEKVRENPLSSLLIAAGIGFIVSTLMKK